MENIEENTNQTQKKTVMEEFNRFIRKTKDIVKRPRLVMKDGVNMSVQASSYHYCKPEKSMLDDYESFEVGNPSEVIEQLKEYVECPVESDDEYMTSVYGWVPKEVIVDILQEHGGIDFEATFNPQKSDKKLELSKQKKAEMIEKIKQVEMLLGLYKNNKDMQILLNQALKDMKESCGIDY